MRECPHGVTAIDLERNSIGDLGANAIADVLAGRPDFERLHLGRNFIHDEGMEATSPAAALLLSHMYGGVVLNVARKLARYLFLGYNWPGVGVSLVSESSCGEPSAGRT